MPTYDFTGPVQVALQAAEEEAILLGHDYIGTEHILLGLDREPSVGATLEKLGLTSERLRAALECSIRRGRASRPARGLPFTSRAERVLELAVTEAREYGEQLEPRHVLLALLREEKGIACEILTQLGVTAEQIRSSGAGSE